MLYLISDLREDVTEGGMARNLAFQKELQKRNAKIFSFSSMGFFYRITCFIKVFFFLYSVKNATIVILQNTFVNFIFPMAFFKYPFLVKILRKVLSGSLKNNTIYFEVNDLMDEQSRDLKLKTNPYYSVYQSFIFKIEGLKFIFASNKMRDYAVDKYKICYDDTQVVINGAPEMDDAEEMKIKSLEEPLRFVYVGTLNKGRQIEDLIEIFSDTKHELYLMGKEGEWINLINKKNIFYLGSFVEDQALKMTSQFDMGVIPYESRAFYYNLCYPTKNSFYIAAELPILSTPLEETQNVLDGIHKNIAIFEEITNWKTVIDGLNRSRVSLLKQNVKEIKNKIYWSTILSELKLKAHY